jgi:hypothetical protein
MGKLGISKTIVIHADQAVKVSSAAARIGYDENGLLDLDIPVFEKEYFIYQPEKYMDYLIERKGEYEKKGKQPHAQAKLLIRIGYDLAQDTVAYIIETSGEILHMCYRRGKSKKI